MTDYIYDRGGRAVGFIKGRYVHAMDGGAVGQLRGASVHTLDGSYVGELDHQMVVDKGMGNPGQGPTVADAPNPNDAIRRLMLQYFYDSERYEGMLTSVRTRAFGVPASAGDASAEAHTVVSKKFLKASASSMLSKSKAT